MNIKFTLSTVLVGLLGLTPVWSTAAALQPTDKVVKICNNFSTMPLWATLSSTPVGGIEQRWSTKKILPLKCISQAVTISHWNAGRAYIYDRDITGINTENNSDGNFQLVEFTFRGPEGTGGTYGQGIGYNYSAVDSVSSALQLGVEATDFAENAGNSLPYTGNLMTSQTDQDLTQLNSQFRQLVIAGWPYFPRSSANGHFKIPGGYNLYALAGGNMLKYNSATPINPATLTKRWTDWVNGVQVCDRDDTFCFEFKNSVITVWNGFTQNAIAHGINPTPMQLAQHITGYVNFGDDANWTGIDSKPAVVGPAWIALAQGVPSESPEYEKYKYPDYNSRYNLDPYVTAIHKNFRMNVYAFSIDDNLGYFDAPTQSKLIIAVGGLKNLPNQQQAQKQVISPFHLNLGPGWSKISLCTESNQANNVIQLNPTTGSSTPFTFPGSATKCSIQLATPFKLTATLVVNVDNNSMLQLSGCTDNSSNSICNGIYINPNTNQDIQGPAAPAAPPSTTNDFLALSAGYTSVTSMACPVTGATTINGLGGQFAFTPTSGTTVCDFIFTTSIQRTLAATVNLSTGEFICPACHAFPNITTTNGDVHVFMPLGSSL